MTPLSDRFNALIDRREFFRGGVSIGADRDAAAYLVDFCSCFRALAKFRLGPLRC